MRKLADILVILAALCFAFGILTCLVGSGFLPRPVYMWAPETFWRGTTALLLFAIALLVRERRKEP
jgi:hypothetical protein